MSNVMGAEFGHCNEGLHVVLALTHPSPEYANPVKDALRNEEVTDLVADALTVPMQRYFADHPTTLTRIRNNRYFGLHSF